MLNSIMLGVAFSYYCAEHHYAEYRYVECSYADYFSALSAIQYEHFTDMSNVIWSIVVAPYF